MGSPKRCCMPTVQNKSVMTTFIQFHRLDEDQVIDFGGFDLFTMIVVSTSWWHYEVRLVV